MSALEGFEVMEVPNCRERVKWNTAEVMGQFLASGNDCMGKTMEDRYEARKFMNSLRGYARRNGLPVSVMQRGELVMLVRDGE